MVLPILIDKLRFGQCKCVFQIEVHDVEVGMPFSFKVRAVFSEHPISPCAMDLVGLIAHFACMHGGLSRVILQTIHYHTVLPVFEADPHFPGPSSRADQVGGVHKFPAIAFVVNAEILDVRHNFRAIKMRVFDPCLALDKIKNMDRQRIRGLGSVIDLDPDHFLAVDRKGRIGGIFLLPVNTGAKQ